MKKTDKKNPIITNNIFLTMKFTNNVVKNKKAFTLVELIIVITILAVLATIAFISFQGYSRNSRDSNRVVTLSNISKGLNIYFTQTSNYPIPEGIYLTGNFNGTMLTQVGYVKENISRLLNVSKSPIDPQTGTNYVYATNPNNKYYQLATILEGTTQITQLIQPTYANGFQAYVTGEYKGLLNYNGMIYNLPSLIITGTGNLNITSYVINKGRNLPYAPSGQVLNNTQTVSEVLTQLTGTSTTLTGIVLPANKEAFLAQSGTLKNSLGYNIDILGQEIFGTQYFTDNVGKITSGNNTLPIIDYAECGNKTNYSSIEKECPIGCTDIGTICGGGILAGPNLVVARPGCNSSGTSCSGGNDTFGAIWKTSNSISPGANSLSNGYNNTLALTSTPEIKAMHPAAAYCGDMVVNNFSDWHLPSYNEMEYLRQGRNAGILTGWSNTENVYWSSTQETSDPRPYTWSIGWNQVSVYWGISSTIPRVRCVRSLNK